MGLKTKIAIGASVALLLYAEKQRKNDTPKIFYKKKLIGGHNGLAIFPIGIFIKESERNNKMLLDHEMVHWKQFQREGFIPFLVKYGIEAFKKGYDHNKYEIEARTLSGERPKCVQNYTSCVKCGVAATVNNPNFRNK